MTGCGNISSSSSNPRDSKKTAPKRNRQSVRYVDNCVRGLLLVITGLLVSSISIAQLRKQFVVEDDSNFDEVDFTLTATSGSYFISPTHNSNPINIYGKVFTETSNPNFQHHTRDRINYVNLNLQEDGEEDLSKALSFKMFGPQQRTDNEWNVYLSQNKPLCLNLHYGIGDAVVDLSGIPVSKLKISSGSADVKVGYHPGLGNKVKMDTFYVKVDLGSISINRMDLAKASTVIADVGFGDLTLDFSDRSLVKSEVVATVGAGNLEILVPKKNSPIKIVVHNSPLCHVKISKSFDEVEENVFVNSSYFADAENVLIFNLDVALGNIAFKEVR